MAGYKVKRSVCRYYKNLASSIAGFEQKSPSLALSYRDDISEQLSVDRTVAVLAVRQQVSQQVSHFVFVQTQSEIQ